MLKRLQFSLHELFTFVSVFVIAVFAVISSHRAIIAEQRLYEVDLLLDRWIDARDISHAERLEAIESLLKTSQPAKWFWDRHSVNDNRSMD